MFSLIFFKGFYYLFNMTPIRHDISDKKKIEEAESFAHLVNQRIENLKIEHKHNKTK